MKRMTTSREVLNSKVSNNGKDKSAAPTANVHTISEPLLCWAASSSSVSMEAAASALDRRWKEILNLAEAEDEDWEKELERKNALLRQMNSSNSNNSNNSNNSSAARSPKVDTPVSDVNSSRSKKRRPLLLFFPFHNQAPLLGSYRSITLFNRYVSCDNILCVNTNNDIIMIQIIIFTFYFLPPFCYNVL